MDQTLQSQTHQLYKDFSIDATVKDVVRAVVIDVEHGTPIRPEELGALVEESGMAAQTITNLRAYLNSAQGMNGLRKTSSVCAATASYHAAAQYLASIEGAKAALPPRQFNATEAAGSMPDYFP